MRKSNSFYTESPSRFLDAGTYYNGVPADTSKFEFWQNSRTNEIVAVKLRNGEEEIDVVPKLIEREWEKISVRSR